MKTSSRRCLLGSALITTIVAGCGSRPLANEVTPSGPRGAATSLRLRQQSVTTQPDDDGAALPVLNENVTLDDYLRYAALNNAGLEAKFQDWKASVERMPQVRTLPDPRFTYGYYLGEVETRVGPMRHSVSLSQTFPWFGKLQDREDAAARHANAAWHRLESARLALSLRVESAYNELYFLKRSVDVTTDTIELLQQLERVARSRYRVGATGHPDIIKVQVELGRMEDRLRQLHDVRASQVARLNAALNRPTDGGLPWPSAVAQRVTDTDVSSLLSALQAQNPELLALQEEVERERIGAEIARKEGLPDLTVGMAYTVIDDRDDVSIPENGDDAILATFSINLPIWREKYDAGEREAIARRLAVASRRREATHQLTSELMEALFQHQDARRRVELYRDTLIPKATESLQASLGSFEQGASDFFSLIDTQRTLLEFQLSLERALVDRATSYARIEQLVGVPLSEINTLSASPEDAP